jgi:hypothetical protein
MRALCKDTYLPELLARILSTNPLQYFCTTRVFFREGIHLVYVVVDYDIKTVVNSVVFRDLLGGEGLRHGDVGIATPCTRGGCWQSNKGVVQYDRGREAGHEGLQQSFGANGVLAWST